MYILKIVFSRSSSSGLAYDWICANWLKFSPLKSVDGGIGFGEGALVGVIVWVVVGAGEGDGEVVGVSNKVIGVEFSILPVESTDWMTAGGGLELHPTAIKMVNTKDRARLVLFILSPRT